MSLESFYLGPGWTVRETWEAEVLGFLDGDVWAIEWQGEEVRERMTARLDVLVWLDHPRATPGGQLAAGAGFRFARRTLTPRQ
ncbi:hypothetical protein ACFVYA_29415 [Amycolatopsis sp. NPDC058278]|uniref:hypothetical protein n=1 Tax=Amycolatopsis sp. NPDC058278 TaxID=3346417 RepID=UPI0036DDDE06